MSAKTHTDAAWRARARVAQTLDRVKIVPHLLVSEGANVAILRQMRGKSAKSLSCNDIKFNIMQIMRLSSVSGRNRCRNLRFDPPLRQRRRVQMLMSPSRTHEKKFHIFTKRSVNK